MPREPGAIAGGDYRQPALRGRNLALTPDGGVTLVDSATSPAGFRSAVEFVPATRGMRLVAVGLNGTDVSSDGGRAWVAVELQREHVSLAYGRRAPYGKASTSWRSARRLTSSW